MALRQLTKLVDFSIGNTQGAIKTFKNPFDPYFGHGNLFGVQRFADLLLLVNPAEENLYEILTVLNMTVEKQHLLQFTPG